jgi:hypothetical protein
MSKDQSRRPKSTDGEGRKQQDRLAGSQNPKGMYLGASIWSSLIRLVPDEGDPACARSLGLSVGPLAPRLVIRQLDGQLPGPGGRGRPCRGIQSDLAVLAVQGVLLQHSKVVARHVLSGTCNLIKSIRGV